jgi:Flp pilus assembly protein CpaB
MATRRLHRTDSVDPTALTRLRQALQPDWVHTATARRIAAGALVIIAALAAVRAHPDGNRGPAVVATHDLTPGVALTADDVRIESRLSDTLPDGSQSQPQSVLGATTAGPVRRGEVITDVRLLGARLAESAAGPRARIVPLHLSDDAVLDVVRSGDVVDIVGAASAAQDAQPRVVATDGVVVLVSAKPKTGAGDRIALVALPPAAANAVAGASLVQTMTLTLH